jgi:hypothetical protein
MVGIQPRSFDLTDSSGTGEGTVVAMDDGNRNIVGSAIDGSSASTIDYLGGIVRIFFNVSEAGKTVYVHFTHLGTDVYNVSTVDGYNIPVQILPFWESSQRR